MRVLTFTSLFPNPTQPSLGIFVYQRVAALARRPDVSVHVIAPVPYFPAWAPFERWRGKARVPRQEQIGALTVCHPRYLLLPKISMPLHGWLMFLGCITVARRLSRNAPFDCIDAHYIYPDGFAAILLGKLLGVPVILSARGTDVNLFPSFRLIRPMIRWALQRAAGIITVSAALKDALLRLGVPADRVRVIPNGVDPTRFYPLNRGEARSALDLPTAGQIVLSVGGLAPHKGFHVLVQAMAKLLSRIPDLKLYIVGEGPMRRNLERQVRSLGVESRVCLVGSQANDRLQLWYNAADVTCLASTREGMPNVVLESMACGTPVVATRVGGVPEVIVSPELGVLVAHDWESLASGLESALHKTWDREALTRAGCSRTWETVAKEVAQYLASRLPRAAAS